MNILFPILLIVGHLLFIWTAAQYLYCGAEGISAISVMRLVLACIFCFSGLYIFHRQKMISPELPVKIYTVYTIARIIIEFLITMGPLVIDTVESIKEDYFSIAMIDLIQIICIFAVAEGIFSIPWFMQHFGLF